jgi:hypothetical protein
LFWVKDLSLRDAIIVELKRRKIQAILDKLSDELYERFPSQHYAHATIFKQFGTLEAVIITHL